MAVGEMELAMMALVGTNVVVGVIALRRKAPVALKAISASQAEVASTPAISPEAMSELEGAAKKAFEAAVHDATERFGKDLDATSERLNQLITRLTTGVVQEELEQYQQSLATARKQALNSLLEMQRSVQEHEQTLQAEVDSELAKRKQFLIERLDRRLGESVSAYIVEALGSGVDLGAQRSFLLASLERHKADLKKDLSDGA